MHTNRQAETLAGRYVLGEMIGQGGMSQVWRARDLRLDRDVAVKVLHPGVPHTALTRDRFEREARAAARINHPNVVAVFDAGEHDDELFLVMECLPGTTLYDEMARGPLAVDRARSIALQVLRGLGAAHALGIVHRDVKPGNVLFAADGSAKLADFGIAKFVEGDDLDLTTTGQVIGTMAYLPPERLHGSAATASGDLYSLGAVLYEALAGRRPFDGATPVALAEAMASTPPAPIESLRPEVDAAFAQAIAGALEKDPTRRPSSAAAMSAVLIGAAPRPMAATTVADAASADRTTATMATVPLTPMVPITNLPPPRPDRRRSHLAWATAAFVAVSILAVALLLAVAARSGSGSGQPPASTPTTVTAPVSPAPTTVAPTTVAPTTAPAVAPAPNGKGKGGKGGKG